MKSRSEQVYTDGSKTEEGDDAFVGAAFRVPSLQTQEAKQTTFCIKRGRVWNGCFGA